MQSKKGYPQIKSVGSPEGRPLIPTLEHLAARINNLVMDESADLWAISRGFNMGKALGNIGLDELIASLNLKRVKAEASDWDGYYSALEKLAREVRHGQSC